MPPRPEYRWTPLPKPCCENATRDTVARLSRIPRRRTQDQSWTYVWCETCCVEFRVYLTRGLNIVLPLHVQVSGLFHAPKCRRAPSPRFMKRYREGVRLDKVLGDSLRREDGPQPCRACLGRFVDEYLGVAR